MEMLTIMTKALLDKGMDFEVNIRGSEVRLRLFDKLEGTTIGIEVSNSLESALDNVLATVASGSAQHFIGLSRL